MYPKATGREIQREYQTMSQPTYQLLPFGVLTQKFNTPPPIPIHKARSCSEIHTSNQAKTLA